MPQRKTKMKATRKTHAPQCSLQQPKCPLTRTDEDVAPGSYSFLHKGLLCS